MRTINEIISEAKNTTYTSQSGPVLDICRELAIDGCFDEIAVALAAWCEYAPNSESFIKARLPAIILNSYLVNQDILTFKQFIQWEESSPEWTDSIKQQALSASGLPSAIATVVNSMRQFQNHV